MTLRVDGGDVLRYAEAHGSAASQIRVDTQPDQSLIAAMAAGYGPVGAELTAAVAQFQTALTSSGDQVAQKHDDHADALRAAAKRYADSDHAGAEAVRASGGAQRA